MAVKDIQPLLAYDEALVIVNLGVKKSYAWAITRSQASLEEISLTAEEVSKKVSAVRARLDFYSVTPFDTQAKASIFINKSWRPSKTSSAENRA